ncbi:MAG: hypothetical protein ACI4TD_10210 [Phocaeicola sp.]
MELNKKQQKLLDKLCSETGLSKMRCQSFLEKNGWDYKKTCEVPVIKSALSHAESLFEFDEPPKKTEIKEPVKNTVQEKRSDVKETSVKGKIKASETTKPSEGKVIHNNEKNSTERKKKASKKTEKESNPKQLKETKRFQKRTHGGITFEVEVINGRDYFNGKEIHCDNSGFYHPYATMKDIMKWTNEHLKKNSYNPKTKIGRD